MAWSNSKIHRSFITDRMSGATAFDMDGDTFKAPLFNNTTTPDKDATTANASYNTGTWATANEIYEAVTWPQGGRPLVITITNPSSGVWMWDSADTVSNGAATLVGFYGIGVYDDTVTGDRGVCFNYLGGVQSVTLGILTVSWSANGVMQLSV